LFHDARWDSATFAARSFYDAVWLQSVKILFVREWCT